MHFTKKENMPTNSAAYTRAYERKHYKERAGSAKGKKGIAARVKARRMLLKKLGKAKLKGKDVDHITPIGLGGKTVASNLRVQSVKENRGNGAKVKKRLSKRKKKK